MTIPPAPSPRLSTPRLVRWMLGYARRRWGAALAVLAVMLLRSGVDLLRPWPMKVLIDHALPRRPVPPGLGRLVGVLPGAGSPEGLVGWCVAATLALFLLTWGLATLSALASISFGQRMIYDLAADLFAHLQRLSLRFHARKPVGDSLRRVTGDSACVSAIVKEALLPVVVSLATLGMMFAVLWRIDPTLTLLALSVLPFMAWVFRRYSRPMMERAYAQGDLEGDWYGLVEQTLSAMPAVQAFATEADNDRRFAATTDRILDAALAVTAVDSAFKVLMGLVTAAGTAAVLWVGGRHALAGRLSVGDILIFLAYLSSLYGPLNALMYSSSTIQTAAGSALRVREVLETAHDVTERPGAVALPAPGSGAAASAVRGDLRFEGVTFGYETGRPVLRAVSLAASPGQTVAIVGPTGAGKSTLAALVPRLFDPWEGRVTLDGHDLRDLKLADLRRNVSLVLQEPFLFPLSVAENIAYGRPGAGRGEIIAAAEAANARQFIEQLPGGYDAVIGERGATLSGGQRQRLSIARALLRDAPVLVLDEPTSALDARTESLLLEALGRLMKGRTTLVIAHRLSTIREADRIVVLHEGRVEEQGTHAELLAAGGMYARLCQQGFGAGKGENEEYSPRMDTDEHR